MVNWHYSGKNLVYVRKACSKVQKVSSWCYKETKVCVCVCLCTHADKATACKSQEVVGTIPPRALLPLISMNRLPSKMHLMKLIFSTHNSYHKCITSSSFCYLVYLTSYKKMNYKAKIQNSSHHFVFRIFQ